jgi:hypothetical protein
MSPLRVAGLALAAGLGAAGGWVGVGSAADQPAIPGPHRGWLSVGPCGNPGAPLADYLDLLLPIVTLQLQASLEVEHAATELAERYEEHYS